MQAIQQLAYSSYFGISVVVWMGILTYIFLIATAGVMVLTRKRIKRFSLKVHKNLAKITIIIATIHFLLALSGNI